MQGSAADYDNSETAVGHLNDRRLDRRQGQVSYASSTYPLLVQLHIHLDFGDSGWLLPVCIIFT